MSKAKRLPRILVTELPKGMPRGEKIKVLRERMDLASKFSNKRTPPIRKALIAQLAIRGRLGSKNPYRKITDLIEISRKDLPYSGVARALVNIWNSLRAGRVDLMPRDHQVLVTLTIKLRKMYTSSSKMEFKLNKSEKKVLGDYLQRLPRGVKIEFEPMIESLD